MRQSVAEAIRIVGGDPTDLGWHWLALHGPHGDSFTWSQTRRGAPGYVGMEHLERIIAEREENNPGFRRRVRGHLALALSSDNENLLRRAIQVAAALGGKAELERIRSMASHTSHAVAADARAAAFHLKLALKNGERDDA